MKEDFLSDFEKASYYEGELRRCKKYWLIRTILAFVLGAAATRAFYILFQQV